MKKYVFYFLLASLCSWVLTRLLLWIDLKYELKQISLIAWTENYIQGWGFSVRKTVFFVLLSIFLITGVHTKFGKWLLTFVGFVLLFYFAAMVCLLALYFLSWISSTL